MIYRLLSTLAEPWWIGLWTTLNTLALAATLLWVVKYTAATKKMAAATHLMAEAQQQETDLRKRPVVSIRCAEPTKFEFRTEITNRGPVHARALVRATIWVANRPLQLTPGHRYDGNHVWDLQAGLSIQGHLGWPEQLEANNIELSPDTTDDVRVQLESRVVYFNDPVSSLHQPSSSNPTVEYYWSERRWIPEVTPQTITTRS